MTIKDEYEEFFIPRRAHLKYVIRYSVACWVSVSMFFSSFILIFINPFIENSTFFFLGVFVFVPAGIFWGVVFGLVIDRLIQVSYTKYRARYIPLTWFSEGGRAIKDWLEGTIAFIFFIGLTAYIFTV